MGIELPRLQKFFCCLPLRVGVLIIGYLSIVLSLLSLSVISFSLYRVVTFVETHNETESEHTPEQYSKVAKSLYIFHAYMTIVYIYYIIISILLIIGVHMNRPLYLRYYVQSGMFLFMLALAMVIVSSVFLHLIATIILLVWCVIIFYCLLVVRSSYLEMEEQNNKRDVELQNLYIARQAPLIL